jgi:hypothetical protein
MLKLLSKPINPELGKSLTDKNILFRDYYIRGKETTMIKMDSILTKTRSGDL